MSRIFARICAKRDCNRLVMSGFRFCLRCKYPKEYGGEEE